MFAYIIRRLGYGVLTILGVLMLLFVLFFAITDPDDIARQAVGDRATAEVYEQWKENHGYNRPLVLNEAYPVTSLKRYSDTLLFDHYRRMLTFDFGRSDADDTPIIDRIRDGAGPSLTFTVPLFLLGLIFGITLSLFVAFFRNTYIDKAGLVLCMLGMSLTALLYIIGGQFLIGKLLRWFPISGYDPDPVMVWRFMLLPVMVGVLSQLGGSIRFYRTVFIEETTKDYVRTARAKGASEARVMGWHVFRNSLLPVLTQIVVAIPFLFTGSLLFESFFGIPGLGALTVEAIQSNDFSTLRTMVFVGSMLFILGQLLTDISYTFVDPRIRLE